MLTKRVADTTSAEQAYMDWHRPSESGLSSGCHMTNIDSVELSDHGYPLSFSELKSMHLVVGDPTAWLRSISEGYIGQGKVGKMFRILSPLLPNTLFLIVAYDFRGPEKVFYVHDLNKPEKGDHGWTKCSETQYKTAIEHLHQRGNSWS